MIPLSLMLEIDKLTLIDIDIEENLVTQINCSGMEIVVTSTTFIIAYAMQGQMSGV